MTRVAATEGKKEEAEASQWGGGGRSSHGTTARLFVARRFRCRLWDRLKVCVCGGKRNKSQETQDTGLVNAGHGNTMSRLRVPPSKEFVSAGISHTSAITTPQEDFFCLPFFFLPTSHSERQRTGSCYIICMYPITNLSPLHQAELHVYRTVQLLGKKAGTRCSGRNDRKTYDCLSNQLDVYLGSD